jgi:hypothetical protein
VQDLRAFLANAKGDAPDAIDDMVTRAALALRLIAHGRPVVVVSGFDDYQRHAARCGSWDAWCRDVAQGIDYLSREPRYHAIVLPSSRVGAATAKIVEIAFFVGKPVLLLDGKNLSQAKTITKVAERDWQKGWEVR